MSPPVGPTGAVAACRGESEAERPRWRIGFSSAASTSELILADEEGSLEDSPLTPRLHRRSLSASLDYRTDSDWTLSAGLGASVGGTLTTGHRAGAPVVHRLDPGPIVVLAASRPLADFAPYFAVLGLSLGVSTVPTRHRSGDGQLTSGDARVGLVVGRLFLDAVAPYAVVRGFGGPVFWQRDDEAGEARPLAGGTDRYHVQAGLGVLATAQSGVDAFVEWVPVGERALSVGLGFSF